MHCGHSLTKRSGPAKGVASSIPLGASHVADGAGGRASSKLNAAAFAVGLPWLILIGVFVWIWLKLIWPRVRRKKS